MIIGVGVAVCTVLILTYQVVDDRAYHDVLQYAARSSGSAATQVSEESFKRSLQFHGFHQVGATLDEPPSGKSFGYETRKFGMLRTWVDLRATFSDGKVVRVIYFQKSDFTL